MTDLINFVHPNKIYNYAISTLDNIFRGNWITARNFEDEDWLEESKSEVLRQYCIDQVSGLTRENIIAVLMDNYPKYQDYIDYTAKELYNYTRGDILNLLQQLGQYDLEDIFSDICQSIDDDTHFLSKYLDKAYSDYARTI